MSLLASWRTAIRIARREARRAKGRSALVIVMIALPVAALAGAAVTYDMFSLTPDEKATQLMGQADARMSWADHQAIEQSATDGSSNWAVNPPTNPSKEPPKPVPGTLPELLTKLPAGSQGIEVRDGTVALRTATGIGEPNAVATDATNPITRGYLEVLEGRAPTSASEIGITKQAGERLGASLGSTVRSADEKKSWTVVGIVEFPSSLDQFVLFAPITEENPAGFNLTGRRWFVDTPGPVTWDKVRELNLLGIAITSRAVLLDPPPQQFQYSQPAPEELAFGVLIGGLALLEIILMAGPAFAVSARRRQRQLALVAANGGTPAHVRRIVLADGVVLGLLGAVVGIGIGIAGAFVIRPWVEELLAHNRAGAYRVFPAALAAISLLALVTGLLAALVPAFVTARQNVVASLAGRRGVTKSKKRWIFVGLAGVAIGVAIALYGTVQGNLTIVLAGLVAGELGLVLCTPAMVGLISRIGRILPLAPRIALRDAARNRAAAAPAISAVMAAVAGSVALGLVFNSDRTRQEADYISSGPVGTVSAYLGDMRFSGDKANQATPANIERAIRETMPISEVRTTSLVTCKDLADTQHYCNAFAEVPPAQTCPYLKLLQTQPELSAEDQKAARADPRCNNGYSAFNQFPAMVDDGTALGVLTGATGDDLAQAVATLRSGGAVIADGRYIENGQVTLAVQVFGADKGPATDGSDTQRHPMPGYQLKTGVLRTVVISPATAAALDLSARPYQMIASTSRMPTQAEEDRFVLRLQEIGSYGQVERGPRYRTDEILWILMAAAALITLSAAGIGTGLAAADGRADLSTLASVGASPRMRRGLSLSQSGVIAGLGSALGAAAGIGTAAAVLVAMNLRYADKWPAPRDFPIAPPWLTLGVALLIVPGIAMLGAGLLTRSRLPIERRL